MDCALRIGGWPAGWRADLDSVSLQQIVVVIGRIRRKHWKLLWPVKNSSRVRRTSHSLSLLDSLGLPGFSNNFQGVYSLHRVCTVYTPYMPYFWFRQAIQAIQAIHPYPPFWAQAWRSCSPLLSEQRAATEGYGWEQSTVTRADVDVDGMGIIPCLKHPGLAGILAFTVWSVCVFEWCFGDFFWDLSTFVGYSQFFDNFER